MNAHSRPFYLLMMLLLAVLTLYPAAVRALDPRAVIVVTTTNLAINGDGQCSLIEAIVNANDDASTHPDCASGTGVDTIELAANATYEAVQVHNVTFGANALPSVTSAITVNGHNATVERSAAPGTPDFRLFHVGNSGTLTLNNLTVRNGRITGEAGAGVRNSGGILIMNDCTLESNLVVNSSGGGAANRGGTMTMNGGTVRNNRAQGLNMTGGGLYNHGLLANATTVLSGTNLLSNLAPGGGGLATATGNGTISRVEISASTFTSNTATQANYYGGGAILMVPIGTTDTASSVTIESSDFFSNTTVANGGAIAHRAIISQGTAISSTLHVKNSDLNFNRAVGNLNATGNGGAIFTHLGNTIIEDSTLDSNAAVGGTSDTSAGNGGAILHQGDMLLMRTTISNNSATGSSASTAGRGGGILYLDLDDGVPDSMSLLIVNSTISGNHALNATAQNENAGSGGGLMIRGFTFDPMVATIINSTIADNNASSTGGGVALSNDSPTVPVRAEFTNTIVAENNAPANGSCHVGVNSTSLSQGNNLEDGNTCTFIQSSDLPNNNPQLGPLGDYGGPTWTHMLMPDSPAINAGNNAICAAPPVSAIDQRSYSRPQAGCDIGAYELADPNPATPTATAVPPTATATSVPPTATASPTVTPTPTEGTRNLYLPLVQREAS